MKNSSYLAICLQVLLSINAVQAADTIRYTNNMGYLHKPYLSNNTGYLNKPCRPKNHNNIAFYLKAEIGKDIFVRDFDQYWALTKPDYLGGKVTNKLMYGFAAGVIFNPNFRADINLQSRRLNYSANRTGSVVDGCLACYNNIQNQTVISRSIFLNGYYDVGGCRCSMFTPYFTAGIGYAYNKSKNLSSTTSSNGAQFPFSAPGIKTHSFAWNIGIGMWTNLAQNLEIDIAYRYAHLGKTGAARTTLIPNGLPVTPSLQKLRVHEIAIGLVLIL